MQDSLSDPAVRAFRAAPQLDLDRLGNAPFEGAVQRTFTAQAAPYFQAFDTHKARRHQALQAIRQELDPGLVVIATFNWGFRQLLENWAASCDRHGIDCRAFTLLFPMDKEGDALARDLGFRTYFDGVSYGDLPEDASAVFGDSNFRKCLFAKIAATQDMLQIGADTLMQDIDMVWLRDPRAELQSRMNDRSFDFLFMYDGPNPRFAPVYCNSGFLSIRNTPKSRYAWNMVFSNYARLLHCGTDQELVNAVFDHLRNRGLRCGRLEEAFVNGHALIGASDRKVCLPASPAVVHASWTSNIAAKIERLRQFDLWYL